MKKYTTKKGTQVTIDGEIVRVAAQAVHISHFHTLNESPEKAYWVSVFQRCKGDISEIGLVALRDICIPKDGNSDLIADINSVSSEYRNALKIKKQAEEKEKAEEREKILNSVPDGCEVATQKFWLDGLINFSALDGATCTAWDDMYKSEGQGLFYIPSDRFADSRKARSDKNKRDEEASADRKAMEDSAFAQALTTGKPAVMRQWTTDRCMNGNGERECSFDSATEWAMPDGSRKTTYTCCF